MLHFTVELGNVKMKMGNVFSSDYEIILQAHHVVEDKDHSSYDYITAKITGYVLCMVNEKHEIILLVGDKKLSIPANGKSVRSILELNPAYFSETATYDIPAEAKKFIVEHHSDKARIQVGSLRCKLEGTVDLNPFGEFYSKFCQ